MFASALLLSGSLFATTPVTTPLEEKSTDPIIIELAQLAATLKLENALAEFVSLYSSTIKLKRVQYGTVDNELAPGYLFTPVNVVPGKKYSGLVFIRGGSHGQFGNHYFELIEEAIKRG